MYVHIDPALTALNLNDVVTDPYYPGIEVGGFIEAHQRVHEMGWRSLTSIGVVLTLGGFIVLRLLGLSEPAPINSAAAASGGNALVIEYVRSLETCGGTARVQKNESDSKVIVTVEIRRTFQLGAQACPAVGSYATTRVRLDAPLAGLPQFVGIFGVR